MHYGRYCFVDFVREITLTLPKLAAEVTIHSLGTPPGQGDDHSEQRDSLRVSDPEWAILKKLAEKITSTELSASPADVALVLLRAAMKSVQPPDPATTENEARLIQIIANELIGLHKEQAG